ncbi:taste receptor type 1 member 2 [Eublepharis macularius]|uniref:Taste receptor type 1 member 2 n=1 Tax=Eublepharis macularius TaxID=481883 RepID=A0AA97KKL6_EUBMA|nr:taste receptor type 1 member 2 [Eublepharis macularius]
MLARAVAACLGALVAAGSFVTTPPSHFHLAGDYILGGLFSLHAEAGSPDLHSQVPVCKDYQLKVVSYSYLQAMRFAVEEINNSSSLLPGISLGYEMVDACYLTNTIHPLLYFLSDDRSQVELQTNYTYYHPRVLAVIGPDSSAAAVTVAYILSLFLVPQITYSATTEALSNPRLFPVAFRTIPSTDQQITVILKFLQKFKWNWVIVLSSDDDYGQQNLQMLRAQATWPCIAFQEIIPVQRANQANGPTQQRIKSVVGKILQSTAKVVIILSLELPLAPFFQEVLQQNITDMVWIAAEAWATDPSLHSIANLSSIGTIFGVAVKEVPVPGFADFRIRSPSGPTDRARAPAGAGTCNQDCDRCLPQARFYDKSLRGTGDRIDFNVFSAVYVVARALHRLLRCDRPEGCDKQRVYPWQLLEEVGRVNFSLLNTTINFDEKGDPPNGFEVIQWQWDVPDRPFKKIAHYESLQKELNIFFKDITWHTTNNTAPKSICSEQCEPGHKKKLIGSISCCFECVPCEAGTFFNKIDNFTCQKCPSDMWSEPGKEYCFKRLVVYLKWEEAPSILLLLCSALGLLSTLGILAMFLCYSDTPVVKSAGGRLCFLMIASLFVGFCNIPFYIGVPTEVKCIFRQMLFTLCFTVCVSCITVRSFQIICAFKMAARLPAAYDFWMKYHGQRVFIGVISAAKFIMLGVTIYTHHLAPVEPTVSSNPAVLNLMCNANYKSSMIPSNVFDMGLSFLCFCFAYIGKALPKNYNEAKYITLSMTCYFSSWVALFLVMSVFEGMVVIIFDAAMVLFNLFSITAGYFGPKCYVILFHPERNTAAFFQTAIQSYTMRSD